MVLHGSFLLRHLVSLTGSGNKTMVSPVLQINKSFPCIANEKGFPPKCKWIRVSPILQVNMGFPVLKVNKGFHFTASKQGFPPYFKWTRVSTLLQVNKGFPVLKVNKGFHFTASKQGFPPYCKWTLPNNEKTVFNSFKWKKKRILSVLKEKYWFWFFQIL